MSNNLESSLPGMPPQTTPESPNPQFDFMLKQEPQPQQTPSKLSNFGKPAKLLIAVVFLLVVAIVVAMVFSGGDSSSKQVVGLMAQNQEIIRVSKAQDQKFSDANTKGLSSTTQSVMNSQKVELGAYLSKANVKYGDAQLAAKMNKNTDTQLQAAAQNNSLDEAYAAYLKTSLTSYLSSLNEAFKTTKSQTLKSTLQSAFNSVQTLLNAPQFRS